MTKHSTWIKYFSELILELWVSPFFGSEWVSECEWEALAEQLGRAPYSRATTQSHLSAFKGGLHYPCRGVRTTSTSVHLGSTEGVASIIAHKLKENPWPVFILYHTFSPHTTSEAVRVLHRLHARYFMYAGRLLAVTALPQLYVVVVSLLWCPLARGHLKIWAVEAKVVTAMYKRVIIMVVFGS